MGRKPGWRPGRSLPPSLLLRRLGTRPTIAYVRTRTRPGDRARREKIPAGVTPLDIIVEISYTFYDLFVMMRKHPVAGKAPKAVQSAHV
jgi:hypothetical protein